MRRLIAAFSLILIFAAGAVPATAGETPDRSTPDAAGAAFLHAFAAKDAVAMAAAASPEHHEMLAEIAEKGEAARAYREVFGGWRHQAAVNWDGKFREPRTKTFAGGKTYVMLPYHTAADGWLGVLMLLKNDAGWYVDDIEKWSPEDYEKEPLGAF